MPGGWKPAFRSQSDAWWLETSFQEPITGDQVPAGDQVPGVGNRAPHHGGSGAGWSDGPETLHPAMERRQGFLPLAGLVPVFV